MRDPRVDEICHRIRHHTMAIKRFLNIIVGGVVSHHSTKLEALDAVDLICLELSALENMARRLTEEPGGKRITF